MSCRGYKVTTGIIDTPYRVHCNGCADARKDAADLAAMLLKVTDVYESLVSSDYEGSSGERYLRTPEIAEARALLARIAGGGSA